MLPLHLIFWNFCWIRAESKKSCWTELHRPCSGMKDEEEDPFICKSCRHLVSHLSSPVLCRRGTKNRIYKQRAWEFLAFLCRNWLLLMCLAGPGPLLWTFYPQPGDISPAEGCETWKHVETLQQLISLSNLAENCCGNATFEDFPGKPGKPKWMQFA